MSNKYKKHLHILDQTDYSIIKHYIKNSNFLTGQLDNKIIELLDDSIIIKDKELYKKINTYIKSIKIQTKLIKDNYDTKLTS